MTDALQATQLRAASSRAGVPVYGARLKQAALGLALAAGIFAGADYGRYYWTTGRYLVTTDDAYIDVHSAMISPKYRATSRTFLSTTTNMSRRVMSSPASIRVITRPRSIGRAPMSQRRRRPSTR
jgi:hypothetical protein